MEDYAAKYASWWRAAEPTTPRLGPSIRLDDKLRRESLAEHSIQEMKERLRRYPGVRVKREVWREDLLKALRRMAGDCLGFPGSGLEQLFTLGALEATRRFIRDARTFDPDIGDDSLFQALVLSANRALVFQPLWRAEIRADQVSDSGELQAASAPSNRQESEVLYRRLC